MILTLLQGILDGLAGILDFAVGVLPASPFSGFYSFTVEHVWLGYLAYIIPIPQIISVLAAWAIAIGVFYLYMIGMRWAKAIE